MFLSGKGKGRAFSPSQNGILPFLIFIAYCNTELVFGEPDAILNRCSGFQDLRNNTSSDINLRIPGNLTNSDQPVDFAIAQKAYKLPCEDFTERNISWEDGTFLNLRFKSPVRGHRLMSSGKWSSHFTHDGHFYEDGNYYRLRDYCVKSISDAELQLEVCSIDCDGNDRICVPKCCGVDEILDYWRFKCRKLSAEEKRWNPLLSEKAYPHKVIPADDKGVLNRLHIQRKPLHCKYFEQWPLSDTPRPTPKNGSNPELYWKLTPNGVPILLRTDRTFIQIPAGNYCVDGFANWEFNSTGNGNGTYSGDREKHSVMLFCPKGDGNFTLEDPFDDSRAWTYSVFLLLSATFPLLTAFVHILLIKTQHLHGLTVLCHAISMFCFYIFLAGAHLLSIFRELKGMPRNGFCLTIAILCHYFLMTTFTWLSVMNFDLWLTFRSMTPVSRMSKRIRRFRLYFCIGWGLPAILAGCFYAIDEIYRDKKTLVPVPDYAEGSCFVATHARGYYLYSLEAIALSFNTVLVLWTFYIFHGFRKQNAHTFTTRRAKSDKYSVRLFIKLFFVMGVAWFVELLSWIYNGSEKPWALVVLDCIMFFQAFAIFFIFCVNRRTLKQLEEKYNWLRPALGPLRKMHWFQAPSEGGGEGCVEMTTPGSTPRKLSLSVTTNTKLDSLPRKTSTSSIRSGTSNKFSPLTKMDSIPLDSDSESGVGTMESLHEIVDQAPAPDLLTNT